MGYPEKYIFENLSPANVRPQRIDHIGWDALPLGGFALRWLGKKEEV